MKLKILSFLLGFFAAYSTAFSQLKVDQYGRIGIGTNYPNTGFKCHIKGNLLLTNYPSTPMVELRMKVIETDDNCPMLGSNADKLYFLADWVNFNTVYASGYYTLSDCKQKTNIKEIQSSLNIVKQLKSYSYNLIENDSLMTGKKTFGYLAQNIENVHPELVDTAMGLKLINYNAILPFLSSSICEQQEQIDSLNNTIKKLEEKIRNLENLIIHAINKNNITIKTC